MSNNMLHPEWKFCGRCRYFMSYSPSIDFEKDPDKTHFGCCEHPNKDEQIVAAIADCSLFEKRGKSMTQEEKQLLLKDILPRQLSGVKAHYQYYDFVGGSERLIQEGDGVIKSVDISLGNPIYIDGYHVEIENIKPYLRPMSSMTEEEKKEYHKQVDIDLDRTAKRLKEQFDTGKFDPENQFTVQYCHIDWLNANHFDYRGLIPMGLALEAPEDMYK